MRHLLSLAMLEMATLPQISSAPGAPRAFPKGPRRRRCGPSSRKHK